MIARNDEALHPLLLQEYALYTPPIAEVFNTARDWVEDRVTGAYVYGVSRMGKTRAIRYWLKSLLLQEFGARIAIFNCVYEQQMQPSQAGFIRALARSLPHAFPTAKRVADLEWRVANFFIIRGLKTALRQVVLIVDEAQYLREPEYHSLCNLQNLADEKSVKITVITVGTHQLAHQRQALLLAHNLHLSARFMARSTRFRGIASEAELRFVLNGFDEETEWPANSGISFTQYFFPKAFSAGFRFADSAGPMWEIFSEWAPESMKKKLEVPMEHVVLPIESICREGKDSDLFTLSRKSLISVIARTDYRTMIRAISGSRGVVGE